MDPNIVALVGALGGLGGVISALVAWRQARSAVAQAQAAARKTDVEAQDVIIKRLQDENTRLCQRLDELELDNERLREELEDVTTDLQTMKDENVQLRKRVERLTCERQQLLEELEWDNPILNAES